jgi:hypothetical protein
MVNGLGQPPVNFRFRPRGNILVECHGNAFASDLNGIP